MLTDEDLKAIQEMMGELLDMRLAAHGLKKRIEMRRTQNAERQQRFRDRNAKVTLHNAKVTLPRAKRNAPRNAPVTHRISYDWERYGFNGITPEDMKRWQEAYPAISIPDQIDRAAIWFKANPKNRKSNYERFLANWFTRAQDRSRAA